jgi:hypothetical protein
LTLDRPVKTQFVILRLTGLLSVSMVREKVEYAILDEELVLWGTKVQAPDDRMISSEDEFDSSKKQKGGWETGLMDEGEHPFPFELDIPPKSMPSSIDVRSYPALFNCSLEKDQSLTQFDAFISDRLPFSACETSQWLKSIFKFWM